MQDGGVIAQEYQNLNASDLFNFILESVKMVFTNETTGLSRAINVDNRIGLSILSVGSLFGFVFKLTLPHHIQSPFMGPSATGLRFNVPIQEFIIKLVVVSKPASEILYPIQVVAEPNVVGGYETIPKKSVSRESLIEEVRIQNYIWKRSVYASRPAICPPVEYANIIEFSKEGKDKANQMLKQFQQNLPYGQIEQTTIQYLANAIYHRNPSGNGGYYYDNRSLGIVLMPAIPGAQTFYEFRKRTDIAIDVVQNVAANIIAQIVRLLIDIQVIHLDLHYANVLVDNKFNSTIIDFGIASQINLGSDDAYFNMDEKTLILTEITKFNQEYRKIGKRRASDVEPIDNQKRDFIINVMNYIAEKDKERYVRLGKPEGQYQLIWTEEYRNNDAIMLSAFDRLYGMMFTNIDKSGDGLSSRTIEKRTSGNLDFPEPDESDEPNRKQRNLKRPKNQRNLKHYNQDIIPIVR